MAPVTSALAEAMNDMLTFGSGAVRVDADGGFHHVPIEELKPARPSSLEMAASVAFWSMQAAAEGVDPSIDLTAFGLADAALIEAAGFVLANRQAPAAAIPTHLALKKLPGGDMTPDDRTITLWSVFRVVLLLVHDFREAERRAAEEKPAEPAGSWPGELAFKPPAPPMAETGFELAR